MRAWSVRVFAVGTAIVASACSRTVTGPIDDLTVVLSVSPAGNSTGISVSTPITITFSRPMMAGMELLVTLHEGTILGPPVSGISGWSPDRMSLTFTPSENLKARTTYVLHLSPGLRDGTGRRIGFAACAQRLGGQPVQGTMSSGMMGGGSGAGGMGPGWQPGAGTWGYGMSFTFTTA